MANPIHIYALPALLIIEVVVQKEVCLIDPSGVLQTSNLTSVCVTPCTAHIQHWQTMAIHLHTLHV